VENDIGYNPSTMNTASIINALKQERDRIDVAIAVLSGGTAGNGRRFQGRTARIGNTPTRRRRRLSAAARRRISNAAKARWAKAKKAGRSSL
jgi:hypothetical protein